MQAGHRLPAGCQATESHLMNEIWKLMRQTREVINHGRIGEKTRISRTNIVLNQVVVGLFFKLDTGGRSFARCPHHESFRPWLFPMTRHGASR